MGSNGMSILLLLLMLVMFYFILIRPQKKKEKAVNAMRNAIQVGDTIVTIGGIVGQVVKAKEDSLVIQVGADKVKFEIKRWAVGEVTASANVKKAASEPAAEDEEPKKKQIKKLRKEAAPAEEVQAEAAPVEAAPEVEAAAETPEEN